VRTRARHKRETKEPIVKTWRKITLGVVGAILVVVLTRLAVLTRSKAHDFVTQPRAARSLPHKTPADYRLPYEDVIVTTTGGLRLVGWYIPSQNGAVIIAQHATSPIAPRC